MAEREGSVADGFTAGVQSGSWIVTVGEYKIVVVENRDAA
jgi:hypothetical protein